jgi:hypothetical protein
VEREDVRVLQVGGDFDFPMEAVGATHGTELGPQDLQCDTPAVLQVFGEIYRGHPAPAELTLDPVALAESRL